MPALPSSLHCRVLRSPYGETRERAIAEFTPDVGRPIRRRRQTLAHELLEVTVKASRQAVADFWVFWEDEIDLGLDSFTMTHPRTGEAITVEFTSAEPPRFDRATGNSFTSSWQLRVLP